MATELGFFMQKSMDFLPRKYAKKPAVCYALIVIRFKKTRTIIKHTNILEKH